MTTADKIREILPDHLRLDTPQRVTDIPINTYVVYTLLFRGQAIITGRGPRSRARVIFDDQNQTTTSHIKSLFVRIYMLVDEQAFERHIVICQSEEDAKRIEREIQNVIGGNTRDLTEEAKCALFKGIDNELAKNYLKLALLSSFSGISDLKKWREHGLIENEVWETIRRKLFLPDWEVKKTHVEKFD